MVSGLLEKLQAREKDHVQEDEDVIKSSAANAYGAGYDTVSTSTYNCIGHLSNSWWDTCRRFPPSRPSSPP